MDYIIGKYLQFYKKNKYIPQFFNAYNCAEIKDFACSLTIGCGRPDKTGSILIVEFCDEK